MCGKNVTAHVYKLTRSVCLSCTQEYIETLPIVWRVPDAPLLPKKQQLINSMIVHGTHIRFEQPTPDAENLGRYHSDVNPFGLTLAE